MNVSASSFFSLEPDSGEAGRAAGSAIREAFGNVTPGAALVYSTMNHDQPAVLEALRGALGPEVPIVGCSVQGIAGEKEMTEEGLALGVMGFGGSDLRCAAAVEREFHLASFEKGQKLARTLLANLGGEPNLMVVLYDPLCGADVEALLSGLRSQVSCPVIGGGAGQPWGPPVRTYQYWDREVLSGGVVALALTGPFATEIGICHGTSSTGISITITKAKGNRIIEIDGRPAIDVWREQTGCAVGEVIHQEHMATWAIGVERRFKVVGPNGTTEEVARMIRGAFGFDYEAGAIIVQTAVPEGARVMFHHRTVEDVLKGTVAMSKDLARRLGDRQPWAVLGFECGARTFPFLGTANTAEEHASLQAAVAPNTPWLGMMAWGEIAPLGGEPAFHNYTYPLAVLTR